MNHQSISNSNMDDPAAFNEALEEFLEEN